MTCPFAGTNRITFNGFTDGIGISGPPQDLPEVFAGRMLGVAVRIAKRRLWSLDSRGMGLELRPSRTDGQVEGR